MVSSEDLFVGIDPGVATGALAIIDGWGDFVAVFDSPWTASLAGGRKEPDYTGARQLVGQLGRLGGPVRLVWIEEIRPHGPKMSGLAIASMVSSYATWRCLLAGVHPVEVVAPHRWRAVMGLPVPRGMTATQKRHAVVGKARGLWPGAPLELVKHDGRATALLIAEACRRVSVGVAEEHP